VIARCGDLEGELIFDGLGTEPHRQIQGEPLSGRQRLEVVDAEPGAAVPGGRDDELTWIDEVVENGRRRDRTGWHDR